MFSLLERFLWLAFVLTSSHERNRVSIVRAEGQRVFPKDVADDFQCSLPPNRVNRYLDVDTRVWRIDDNALDIIDNDLQAIINCSQRGDVILFDVENPIRPKRRVTIPWNLTLSAFVKTTQFEDDTFPKAASETTFTCPSDNETLFYVTSRDALFANLAFVECSLRGEERKAVVDMGDCETEQNGGTIRFHRVRFENNTLESGTGLNFSSSSCSSLEMRQAAFLKNVCRGLCWGTLSGQNTLDRIRIEGNSNDPGPHETAVFFYAKPFSHTNVSSFDAVGNNGTLLVVFNGTLSLSDASFERNQAVHLAETNGYGGACVHLIRSEATIERCRFLENNGFDGTSIFMDSSQANLSDCRFERNHGGSSGIYNDGSSLRIDNCDFVGNSAQGKGGGSIYVVNVIDPREVVVNNSSFIKNKSEFQGGALYVSNSILRFSNSTVSENRSNKGAGVYIAFGGYVYLENVQFLRNNATESGAGIFVLQAPVTAINTIFTSNEANLSGGGVYLTDEAFATFQNASLLSNVAKAGGGIHCSDSSTVNFIDSKCIANVAEEGGAIVIEEKSEGNVESNDFVQNVAEKSGGSLYVEGSAEVTVKNCKFNSNTAEYGGVVSISSSLIKFLDSFCEGNSAERGGCLYSDPKSTFVIKNVAFSQNSATWGGSIYFDASEGNFTNVTFENNSASISGGAVYLEEATSLFSEVQFSQNEARQGGGLFLLGAHVLLSNNTFKDCTARNDGGCICAQENSTVMIYNGIMQRGVSTRGGAVSLENSDLKASRFYVSNCSASDGGAIHGFGTSTFLCAECSFKNNSAANRGGGVSIESLDSQLLAIQFDQTLFEGNNAIYGGGLHVFTSDLGIDCAKPKANCTFVVLSSTIFKANHANRGGSLFVTDLKSIRLHCSSIVKEPQLEFYTRKQWESMNSLAETKNICSDWKGNNADEYGNNVATYAVRVEGNVENQENHELNSDENPFEIFIRNYSSGSTLPDIDLTMVDQIGQYPAILYNVEVVTANVSSKNGFLLDPIVVTILNGSGSISGIIALQTPDNYTLNVTFDQESLNPLSIIVEVRKCFMGETSTQRHRLCHQCNAANYNFLPNEENNCQTCPDNANCTTALITPNNGYWHPFPCSIHIERCLSVKACDFGNRENRLYEFVDGIHQCDFTEYEKAEYQQWQCKKGHTGVLCGSCQSNFGRTHSFDCGKCFSVAGNVALFLLSVLILLGLVTFTVRGNLKLRKKSQKSCKYRPESVSQGDPSSAPILQEIEMMEMYCLEVAPKADLATESTQKTTNATTNLNTEFAKWKAAEMFKITVNFLQITAIAFAINVKWSEILVTMFKVTEYIGGVTSETSGRSIDCIVPEGSVPRSILSVVITLLVPVSLIAFSSMFWLLIKMKRKETVFFLTKRMVLSSMATFYISYISITKLLVSTLNCIYVYDSTEVLNDDTSFYWAVDTNVVCYKDYHSILAGTVGWPFVALFVLGFPISTAYVILKNVEEDFSKGWIYETTGFMYRSYRPGFIFWESIIMLRKAALAIVVVFAYPLGSNLQAISSIFVLVLASYLQNTFRPFRKEFDVLNRFESLSLLVSLLTFVSSSVFDNERVGDPAKIFLTVLVFLLNVIGFLVFVFAFFNFGAQYLRAVLEDQDIAMNPSQGIIHTFRTFFLHGLKEMHERLDLFLKHIARSMDQSSNTEEISS